MVIPPRAPSAHSGALSSQGHTGLHPLIFSRSLSFSLGLTQHPPPTSTSTSTITTHAHTHPSNLGIIASVFDGSHSPAKSRGFF